VAYIFSLNCVALVSFALLSPAAALWIGLAIRRLATQARGLSGLIAGGAMARNPVGSVPVVAAIVVGLGWILADTSLIVSLKSAWLRWLDDHYQSDLMVSAGGMSVSLLTYPPIAEQIVDGVRALPGVSEAQGVRAVEMSYEGRPFVVQAMDPSQRGLPLVDRQWSEVREQFNRGDGIVLTENFAYRTGLRTGESMRLTTAAGAESFPVLGTYVDFQGNGDIGGIAISRARYRASWNDPLVSRIRVWVDPGADVTAIRNAIQQRFGAAYGVHAVTFAQARAGVVELVDGIFSINYAVVLIALTVSFIGVTNFLLAAVLDRRTELRTLDAVGVSAGQIGRAVVLEGSLLGVVGVLIGLAAGYVVARIIVLHSVPLVTGWRFALLFPQQTSLLLCAAGIALAAGAGILPARLATRRRTYTEPSTE
jgi:putative ABC transport system permease protein